MREKVLKEAKELFNESGAILLSWATGLGKTLASLKLVDENKRIVVLCQELGHIENWKRELKKHGLEFNIEFYTYASMHKVQGSGYDLILDESHWCTSEMRQMKLGNLSFDRIVMLSASMEESDIQLMRKQIPKLAIHEVKLQEAIDEGVLPEPDVKVLEFELDNTEKQYLHITKRGTGGKVFTCTYGTYFKTLAQARKNQNYYVVCACTEQQKYKLLEGEANSIKRKAFNTEALWKVYNFKKLEMKRFIAYAKTTRAEKLIEELRNQDTRFIAFSYSIDQARQFGDISIHSKNSEKDNQRYIDDFNAKLTNELITVKKLRESLNLVDIQTGLVVQIDNKERSPIQMIGRILRGQNPVVYIMVMINTIDDAYIRTNLSDIRHERLHHKFAFG